MIVKIYRRLIIYVLGICIFDIVLQKAITILRSIDWTINNFILFSGFKSMHVNRLSWYKMEKGVV